jgi:hypothetical protein
MLSKGSRSTWGFVIAALLFSFCLCLPAQSQETIESEQKMVGNGGSFGDPLEGTWSGQATVRNCQTGAIMQSFSRLTSFYKGSGPGGSVLETSTGLTSAQRSPALGTWQHISFNSYQYVVQFFRFDAAGAYIGSTRARWSVTVFGDYLRGQAHIDVLLPNGVVVASICGDEMANRFQ